MVDLRRRGEGRASKSIAGEGGAICDLLGNVTDGGGSIPHQLEISDGLFVEHSRASPKYVPGVDNPTPLHFSSMPKSCE